MEQRPDNRHNFQGIPFLLPRLFQGSFSKKIFFCREHHAIQIFSGNIVIGIGRFQRIQKVRRNPCVKNFFRFFQRDMFENCLDVHGTEHCTIRQGFQLSTKVIPGKKSSHRNLIDFFFIQDQSYGIHLIRVCKNGNTHLLFPRCFFKQGLHPGKIITGKNSSSMEESAAVTGSKRFSMFLNSSRLHSS